MRFGSLFSGVGGLDLGLERAGWRSVFHCEANAWRREVLQRRFPGRPVFDDVRALRGDELPRIDALVGGFPCQDLSVAGKRAGLAGERSGLFYEVARLANELKPEWLLLENVPGLLTSHGGADLEAVIATLDELGYVGGWRVLDAQNFGVPQRRRRVFLVGHRGNPARVAEALFECEGGTRHLEPGPQAGARAAAAARGGARAGGCDSALTLPFIFESRYVRNGRGAPSAVCPPLKAQSGATGKGDGAPLLVCVKKHGANHAVDYESWAEGTVARCLNTMRHATELVVSRQTLEVRRLTPREHERLQGFPDGWTLLEPDTKDAPRYHALGDAVAVPVAEWLGRRVFAACGD